MKLFRIFIFIVTVSVIIFPSKSFSQKKINPQDFNSWSAGFKFGLLPFYGDVRQLNYSTENKYKKTNTGISLELTKNFNAILGLKGNFLFGGLSGSSPNLNLHFNTNFAEYSFSGIVNVNDLISVYPQKEKLLNFYLYAGAGLINFRSKVYSFDENIFVRGYGWDSTGVNKTKGTSEFVFPVGVGVKYKADPKIDIGLEMVMHFVNTDKLDAWVVENSYKDKFGYAALSITYKIGVKKEYVDWANPYQDTTNVFAQTENMTENNTAITNNNKTTNTNSTVKNTTTNNTSNTNNTKTDTAKTIKNNATNNTVVPAVDEKNYFVVSSAYKTKKLAKAAVAKLKTKGYPDAQILGENKSGSWRVSLKGYVTMDEAIADYPAIKKSYSYAKLFEKKGKGDYTEISANIVFKLLHQLAADTTSKVKNSKTNVTANNSNTNNTTTNNTTTTNTSQNTVNNTTTSTNTNVVNNTNQTNPNTNNTSNNSNSNTNQTNSNTNNTTNNSTSTTNSSTNNQTTVTVVKKFYIIAASYPTEQDAKSAVDALKAKGFPDAEVVGKNDLGSYRICYKGYATKEEANKDLAAIKLNTNPSAWVFEKK